VSGYAMIIAIVDVGMSTYLSGVAPRRFALK